MITKNKVDAAQLQLYKSRSDVQPPNVFVSVPPLFAAHNLEVNVPEIKKWLNVQGIPSPLLCGKTGCGKTFQLYATAKELARRFNKGNQEIFARLDDFSKPEYLKPSIKIISELELFYDLRKMPSQSSMIQTTEIYSKANFLFVDDVGTIKIKESELEIWFAIINYRLTNRLPLFLTTNLTLGEIAEHYGERIASKLTELCQLIEMPDKDYRRR